jgi:ABC-type multidrug transport system fused ATPase/permease subunit
MASKLHNENLDKVMRAPNNLFFDVTPFGKLQGNFTSDLGKVNTHFYFMIHWVAESVFSCTIKVVGAVYFNTLMCIPIALNLIWLKWIQGRTFHAR